MASFTTNSNPQGFSYTERMPKQNHSSSSAGSSGASEADARRFMTESSRFESRGRSSQGRDESKSPSPQNGSSSGSEQHKPRRRSKKFRTSFSAASMHDDNSKHAKFIQKVYEMASAPENHHAMGFSEDGLALEIRHVPDLAPILGRYFKHSNPSSFIRQLNNYGFKTISSTALGSNRHVFAHPHFRRDDNSLLETITRKTAVCVKKKSKGEIIRELQLKNEEQQSHLQQMEMHHLEMFQRIMALEAENKQLRAALDAVRIPYPETINRSEFTQANEMPQGMNVSAPAPVAPLPHYPHRFRGPMTTNHGMPPSMPPPPTQMYHENGVNPYYSGNIPYQGMGEGAPTDRDTLNINDPFHLD